MENKVLLARWKKISAIIAEEIAENESFASKISAILGSGEAAAAPKPKRISRRAPAKIDPFALLAQGTLAQALATLTVDELKDVIAANGMDPAKLAMRWKKHDRLANHIMEATQKNAAQGAAFWQANA